MVPNAPKHYETQQNVFDPMGWIGCVLCEKFQRDIVARTFTPVNPFWTECCWAKNGPKCTQIVWNAPNHEFTVQWGGSGAFVQNILTRLRGTNFCISSARFASSFVSQPNGPKCIKIVWNMPKHEFRVQWVWIGCVRCKQFRRDFVLPTFALVQPILHRVS